MTNEEAYDKLFSGGFNYYDESKDSIYNYPCDDLHGMFSSGGCNCSTKINREYISQSDIDKKITDYEKAQQVNADLYQVSVTLRGDVSVNPCNSSDERKQNVLYHVGTDTNYTMYCYAHDIEKTKKYLQELCIGKLHSKIEIAENELLMFLERIVPNESTNPATPQ